MRKILKILLLIILLIILYFLKVYFAFNVKDLEKTIEDRYSVLLLDKNNKTLGIYRNSAEQYHLKNTFLAPDNLKKAVINFEDKRFYHHKGVDVIALGRSVKNNILGKRKSGASTITMQLVKIYKKRNRTYFNKIEEIIESFKLDINMEKAEILEFYLNNIPYGGNIVGYRTASEIYLGKSPEYLTIAEASLLAVLPNSPGNINIEKNRELLLKKRNFLLKRLYERKEITENEYKLAIKEKIPTEKKSIINLAPHLGRRLIRENKNIKNISTTIDIELQKKVENIGKMYHDFLKIDDVNNLSILVIENKTSSVRAYVGSQDFLDFNNNGQVDGIISKRAAGSVLKPFLYALSIDEGIISPKSQLPDVPLFFSNFSPKNANKKYSGMISAEKALIGSLNIPFVRLLEEYGEEKFYYFLKEVLKFSENDPSRYGLSLILGTKELSPEELGVLYSGLANYGKFRKLNYLVDDEKKIDSGEKILTEGSSYLTLNTLRMLNRPGLDNLYKEKEPLSWKTGTSYGRKDAWAAGMSPEYTIVVWAGNFTGKPSASISGAITGGRLLLSVYKELSITQDKFKKPEFLKHVEIDKLTGYRNIYEEIETSEVLMPSDGKALRSSPYLKKIYVDSKGMEVNSLSENFSERKAKVILNYPIEVLNYLSKENIKFNNDLRRDIKIKNLKIIYPSSNLKIYLPKDFDGKKPLIVEVANLNNSSIYWYLNDKFLGSDKNLKKEIQMSEGIQRITVVSATGERDSVEIKVIRAN